MAHSPSPSGTANQPPSPDNANHGQSSGVHGPDWRAVCQWWLERSLPATSMQTKPESAPEARVDAPGTLQVQPLGESAPGSGKGPTVLLEELLAPGDGAYQKAARVGILGTAGSGKTFFLQYLAQALLAKHQLGQSRCLPLWLNPAQIKEVNIREYLLGPWLEQVAKTNPDLSPEIWQRSLKTALQGGLFCLLIDDVGQILPEPEEGAPAGGPLARLRPWLETLGKTSLVVSCGPESQQNEPNGLTGFKLYQMRPWVYPDDLETAIAEYFRGEPAPGGSPPAQPNPLAASLIEALEDPVSAHLRSYVLSPQRLMLCCRFWQDETRDFPTSGAGLYSKLTAAFYRWQGEWVETKPPQQRELQELLAQVAQRSVAASPNPHHPLAVAEIEGIFGKDSPRFNLALQLGWLIPKTIVRKGIWERGYGFADRTFRDYFAALAIANWEFFFDIYGHHYRLFEPHWPGVLQFWWGREDIAPEDKAEFLQALLDFDDRCSPENFYGLRALEMAALGLRESPSLPQGQGIVQRLLDYALLPCPSQAVPQQWAAGLLAQSHRSQVIDALVSTMTAAEDDKVYLQCCQWLGQWGQGSAEAIELLEKQLELHRDSSLRFPVAAALALVNPPAPQAIDVLLGELHGSQEDFSLTLQTLAQAAVGNGLAISALVDFLSPELSVLHHRQVLQCLEAIAKDDGLVIANLLQKLRVYPEGSFLCQIAESLEKIDPGNPTALVVLQRHMQLEKPLPIRKQAIYSLGEVSAPSALVVKSLAALLEAEQDIFVRWLIVSSLAKIGQGQPTAIATLTALVQQGLADNRTEEGDWLINEAIQALIKIDQHNTDILPVLVSLLENTEEGEHLQNWAEILGRLDPGNPTAINTLLRLLRKSEDEYTQRQAASHLAAIDPGNLSALMVLISLLQNSKNDNIRLAAAQNLGLVGRNNPAVLAALIRTAASVNTDGETLRGVVQALARIGQNNKEVAQTLLSLLRQSLDDRLRQAVVQALVTIAPRKLLATVVYQLKEFVSKPLGQNGSADWQLFWHCAQHLSYPDFYQAWHQQPLGGTGTTLPGKSPKQRSFFRHSLSQNLQRQPEPLHSYCVIWIDTGKFLDPEDPSVDIYDQMLDQNCPEFSDGIPDSLSKLRFYWHQLERKGSQPHFLIFEDLGPTPPDRHHLWEQLASFQGAIAVLSGTPPATSVALPYFQLQDSQTTTAEIIAWLQKFTEQ